MSKVRIAQETWHYKLWKKSFEDEFEDVPEQTAICPYFWRVVFCVLKIVWNRAVNTSKTVWDVARPYKSVTIKIFLAVASLSFVSWLVWKVGLWILSWTWFSQILLLSGFAGTAIGLLGGFLILLSPRAREFGKNTTSAIARPIAYVGAPFLYILYVLVGGIPLPTAPQDHVEYIWTREKGKKSKRVRVVTRTPGALRANVWGFVATWCLYSLLFLIYSPTFRGLLWEFIKALSILSIIGVAGVIVIIILAYIAGFVGEFLRSSIRNWVYAWREKKLASNQVLSVKPEPPRPFSETSFGVVVIRMLVTIKTRVCPLVEFV